jgi:PTS system cellobiose-specific IIC component
MKFTEFIQQNVVPTANRIASNKFLKAISDGFMALMPVIIIGAIFSLLNSLAIAPYQNFITATGLKPILSLPNMVTNDILALYAVFFIAYHLAKYYEKDPATAGMIALFTFLAVTPLANTADIINKFLAGNNLTLANDIVVPAGNVIPYEWIGAKGLFVAIIIGLVSTVVYNKLLDKGLAIKMPEGVPPTIAKSFGGLIPGFVIIILFMAVNKVVTFLPNITGLHSVIYTFIQGPMELLLGNSLGSFLVAILVAQLLWFFGIHGVTAVILPIFYPLWTSLTTANIAALNAGVSVFELPNIINRTFFSIYAITGGSGMTLGLCLYMVLWSKSKQYQTLGKLALPANICGINEPVLFATPVVLNPYMLIPWILTPVVSAVLAYGLTVMNILPRLSTVVPLGTPVIMSGFLAGGVAGWRVALFQIAMIIIGAVIYIPFFKVIDKKAYENEKQAYGDVTSSELELLNHSHKSGIN